MKPRVTVFMSEWHQKVTRSTFPFVHDVLSPYLELETVVWDCIHLPQDFSLDTTLLFLQYLPPVDLLQNPKARIVWIPQGDGIVWYPYGWWEQLPQNMRIVSFSKVVEDFSRRFGFKHLCLKFFKNPADYQPVNWNQSRTMFYWNRTGLFRPKLLQRLCDELEIKTFYFLSKTDPNTESDAFFTLPDRVADAQVIQIDSLLSHTEYKEILSRAHFYIAPRIREGIGMAFLEAMAAGAVVLASDAPTMNEYIIHQKDGFLLRPTIPNLLKGPRRKWDKLLKLTLRKTFGKIFRPYRYWFDFPFAPWLHYPFDEFMDLSCLSNLNFQLIGNAALEKQKEGYREWLSRSREYAQFISEW